MSDHCEGECAAVEPLAGRIELCKTSNIAAVVAGIPRAAEDCLSCRGAQGRESLA